MIFCSAVKFVRLVTKISCCHRNCQSLTVHLSGIKFEDVSINLCFKCSWLHGNSIHFLQLWMELHWFWWGCQHIIVWKLTPVLNFLSQSEETPGGYCYLYWILPQVTFKVYHTKLWGKKKKPTKKTVIIFYLWAEKGFHSLTPDLNSFYSGCCNLTSYTKSLYWLRDSAVTENGKGSAWEMRVNGKSALWAVKEEGGKRRGWEGELKRREEIMLEKY